FNGASGLYELDNRITQTGGSSFGFSTAMEGDLALVGAPLKDVDTTMERGAAYVYQFNGSSWVGGQQLLSNNIQTGPRFGHSVALAGGRAMVGAPLAEVFVLTDAGTVYVYEEDKGVWGQSQFLHPSDALALDPIREFGFSIAMEGNRAVIGAPGDSESGTESGSVFVFERDTKSGEWQEVYKLLPDDGEEGDRFGHAVGLSGDFVYVGAPFDDDVAQDAGAIYLFELNSGARVAQQLEKYVADTVSGHDRFGEAISVDGIRVLVGASRDDDRGPNAGAAYAIEGLNSEPPELNFQNGFE
ncbi:MAG: hypothetical protein R3245_02090, partial [Kiloniellales bacterium]|nr:hypothetical protein [Kiloniellales bacterium]